MPLTDEITVASDLFNSSLLTSLFFMNILARFFVLLCSVAFSLIPITTISAQVLPDTTRLLRLPPTNGTQIVLRYVGELYTIRIAGGTARRLTSGPVYS